MYLVTKNSTKQENVIFCLRPLQIIVCDKNTKNVKLILHFKDLK
jgi:hypothetical protein